MSAKDFEIAIIGGGIAGVTLAIGLHQRNIRCTLYEQSRSFREIGAGVGLAPNAVRAMLILSRDIGQAFEAVATHNKWESKRKIWFDFLDGTAGERPEGHAGGIETIFTLQNAQGQNAAHRARFLDEMVKYLPEGFAHFKKHLDQIEEDNPDGKLRLKFHDGTTAEADAVVGCDGIKSRTREIIVGDNHPAAKCVYTHKYAYRGMIPMKDAVDALGEERATNACFWVR